MGIGGGMLFAAVLLPLVFGHYYLSAVLPGGSTTVWAALMSLVVLWLLQGPAEEILFRGYLLPVMSTRWGPAMGVAVSSTLFAAAHLANPSISTLPVINLALAGVFFALYALAEDGLWGVFGAHAAWNWFQGDLLGLPVSGIDSEGGLLRMDPVGPDWLTGGAFGPEGGAYVTLMLVVGCAVLVGVLRRRVRNASGGEDAPSPPE
jgi:membrane protease YdiL (CAAX protease family)